MSVGPKKIAVLSTVFHPGSHTDVIVSRWLEPFPNDARHGWNRPLSKIASIYVEQKAPTSDMTPAVKARYGVAEFESIEGALTLGGPDLAVDAVMIIAEHGTYPENEFRQKLYPRKEFFDAVLAVFERSGRVVPLFFDKHLSWNPAWIEEMHSRIIGLGIPFFGGSSLPFSLPENLTDLSSRGECEEIVAVYFNSLEAYLFHSAELVESIVEQQSDSPAILGLTAWEGDGVWEALDRGEFSSELLEAACASSSNEGRAAIQAHRHSRGGPVYAFQIQYRNGPKAIHFMQKDIIRKWCLSARFKKPAATIAGTVRSEGSEDYYPHFARLCAKIEDFFQTGRSPVPIDRIRRTSITTALAMRALATPGQKIPFPIPNQK